MTTNEAIYTVITTKYKKDAPIAHEIIKSAGLEAYKSDGSFTVKNPITNKRVEYSFNSGTIYLFSVGHGTSRIKDNGDCKINFMKYLVTPWNMDWDKIIYDCRAWGSYHKSDAVMKYEQIKTQKKMIKNTEERIESIKKSIEHLQNQLVEENLDKVRYEQQLQDLISQFGLNTKGA